MSSQPFSPDTSVAQTLAVNGVAVVFIRRHTTCVGCDLARFCTLRDVAQAYSLPLDDLLEELEQAALPKLFHLTGANNAT